MRQFPLQARAPNQTRPFSSPASPASIANQGLIVVAGVAFAAFQNLHASVDRLVIELRFRGPAAGEIAELVAFTGRQIPGCRLRAFDIQRRRGPVCDGGAAADDAVAGINEVVERDPNVIADIFEFDVEIVVPDAMGDVVQDKVAIAVLRG